MNELAPRWRRLLATIIDMILVPTLTLFFIVVAGTVEDADDFANFMWIAEVLVLAILAYLLINGFILYRRGQTVGKLALGIRIVDNSSEQVAPFWKLVCIRALFFPLLFLLPIFPLTLIPVADQAPIFLRARRCLHDYAAGTRVVRVSA